MRSRLVTLFILFASTALGQTMQSSGRYFVDSTGNKTLMIGDAAWVMAAQLSYASANMYMADRASRGFNLVIMELVDHNIADNAPNNANGDPLWNGTAFQSTLNSTYLSHVDSLFTRAGELGITILMTPVYLGFDCGSDGWCAEVSGASVAQCKTYGTYIGDHFKNTPNLMWFVGGDYDVAANTDIQTRIDSIAQGIRQADVNYSGRLMTYHGARASIASDTWAGRPWFNLNDLYASIVSTFSANLYNEASDAYDGSSYPFFVIESVYENEHSINAAQFRAQAYWCMLRGGTGFVMGNCPMYGFDADKISCDASATWQGSLNSQGSQDMTRVRNLFLSRNWYNLVPDRTSSVMTSGEGSGGTFATTAYASDSSSIIAYIPTQRSVTIDPSTLKDDSIHVWWYDPSNGNTTDAGLMSRVSRSYTQQSSADWVLVIDSKSLNVNPPGNLAPPLHLPSDGSTELSTDIVFEWNSRKDAERYTLEVASDPGFNSIIFVDSLIIDTTREVSGLASSTTYYWRVRLTAPQWQSAWSNTWSFTIDENLPVQLISFTGGIEGENVVLEWRTLTEVNNFGFTVLRNGDSISFVPGHGTTLEPQYYQFIDSSVTGGSYAYRLQQIEFDGTVHTLDPTVQLTITSVAEPQIFGPQLLQNYPNPFNGVTQISFSLEKVQAISLVVFDVLGREVARLIDHEVYDRGNHVKEFLADDVSSGIYFYALRTQSGVFIKPMVFAK